MDSFDGWSDYSESYMGTIKRRLRIGYALPRQFGRGRLFSILKMSEYLIFGKTRRYRVYSRAL